jgi:hypothetical protein
METPHPRPVGQARPRLYFHSVYRLTRSWSTVQTMSPRVAVSTAESGVGTVGRCAPRGTSGRNPGRGWCSG